MCGPAARTNGPQHAGAPAHASTLKPALIVVRALQIAVAAVVVIVASFDLITAHVRDPQFDRGYPYRSGTTHVRDPYEARNTGRQEASEQGWVWVFCNLGLCLAACVLSLSFSITWLVYTACPRQRARNARCMNKNTPGCMTYTCDMAWDIVLMVWWLCLIAVVMPLTPYTVMRSPWFMVYYTLCALMWMLFLISAVLSGLVRKSLLMPKKCEKDIAHKCDVELGKQQAGECDLTPPAEHCEVTRVAEPAVVVGKE